jgi:hypothetical protein
VSAIYVQIVEHDGVENIRKWSREPFDGCTEFVNLDAGECIYPKCGIRHGGRTHKGEPLF